MLQQIGHVVADEESGRWGVSIDQPYRAALTGLDQFGQAEVLKYRDWQ